MAYAKFDLRILEALEPGSSGRAMNKPRLCGQRAFGGPHAASGTIRLPDSECWENCLGLSSLELSLSKSRSSFGEGLLGTSSAFIEFSFALFCGGFSPFGEAGRFLGEEPDCWDSRAGCIERVFLEWLCDRAVVFAVEHLVYSIILLLLSMGTLGLREEFDCMV